MPSNFDVLIGDLRDEVDPKLIQVLIELSKGNIDRSFQARNASFGDDTTNFTGFDESGHMTHYGGATTYDDLPPVAFVAQKLGGAGADPTIATFIGDTELYKFAINDLVPGLQTEVLHKYKEGSDISIHLHWANNGVDVDARGVKWQVAYTIANGNTEGAAGVFGAATTVSAEVSIPAGTTDRTHFITNLGTISGTNLKIGAYIVAAFSRIAATGTAPSADPFAIALGYHVQQDTTGSNGLFTK